MKTSALYRPARPLVRREFIRHLGASSLLLPSLSLVSSCNSKESQSSEKKEATEATGGRKLGIALVGLGNYSEGQLAPALEETKLCRLAGIVTGTPDKAEKWKSKYNIPEKNSYTYETFDQLADNPDIDIVYVVLPDAMHAEYAIRAAQAGKHVICEKPMALNSADCQRMIDASKKRAKS